VPRGRERRGLDESGTGVGLANPGCFARVRA